MSNILGGPSTDEPATGPTTAAGDEALADADPPDVALDRARLYALLSIGLDRPGAGLEELLATGTFGEELEDAAAGLDDPAVIDATETVVTAARSVTAEELVPQWGSLFGVEEGVTVSPYELTYLPGPLLTTTRDLADISGFYRAFDLRIAEGRNDRADHVLFQTEFLSHLSLRVAALREAGDSEGVGVVVGARRSFLEDHLGRWHWRFAEEVSAHDDGFYAALTDLLAASVDGELARLDLEPDWVPDDPEVVDWTEDVFGDTGRGCGGCAIATDQPDADGGPGLATEED